MKKTKAKVKVKKKIVKKKKPRTLLITFGNNDYYEHDEWYYCDCPDCQGHKNEQ